MIKVRVTFFLILEKFSILLYYTENLNKPKVRSATTNRGRFLNVPDFVEIISIDTGGLILTWGVPKL